jgi:hypothetical protein
MTTATTSLLGLALPVTGELSGTWGDTVNNSITSLLDSAVAGTTTITTDADITLTTTTLAANEARQAIIRWATASGTTTRYITAPAQSKVYAVINDATAAQSIVLRGVGPTTGITIVQGEKCVAAWNGTDFVKLATSTVDGVSTISFASTGLTPSTATSGAVTVAGTLITTNGGTGLSSYTAGDTLYYAAGTLLSKLAIGASGTIKTSTGTAPQWVASLNTTQGGTGLTSYTAGDITYYASGTALSKLGIGSSKTILTSSGTAPQWSASLDTSQGGTGLTTFTAGDLVYFASGTSFTKLGIGTNGQVLTSSGTAPQWTAASSVGVTTISFGSTGLTPSTATSGAVTVAGTLALTNGGTGGTSVATAQTSLQVDPAGTAVAMAIALG